MGACPEWYNDLARTTSLRHAWPGVAPWEWDEHPIYRDRVLCMLIAEQVAAAELEKRRQAEQAAAAQQGTQ